eukprot:3315362-Rhodomonas_salina.1
MAESNDAHEKPHFWYTLPRHACTASVAQSSPLTSVTNDHDHDHDHDGIATVTLSLAAYQHSPSHVAHPTQATTSSRWGPTSKAKPPFPAQACNRAEQTPFLSHFFSPRAA